MYVFIFLVGWLFIGKIAAHSAYDMFLWYKYLIVNLVFSPPRYLEWESFLIAPFPDLYLLVPFFCSRKENWFSLLEFKIFFSPV